jgi:hypothetical protein
MSRFNIYVIFLLTFITVTDLFGNAETFSRQLTDKVSRYDTLNDNQVLFNGRIWRNIYFTVHGDQFLFTKEFLPGSLSISGKTFKNIYLKYDIFKDEILTPVNPGGILQVNKEMVDSFSVFFQNKTYRFVKIQDDSLTGSKTYFNVLYKGKTALFHWYRKKIEKLADEGKYDKFYQISRICFVKDNIIYPISGKSDLMKVLINDKEMIKNYIKINKLRISEKEPESFIPVIRYYDSIVK